MTSVMSLEMPLYIFNLLSLGYSGYKWNDFRSNNLTSSIECSSWEQVDDFSEALYIFKSICVIHLALVFCSYTDGIFLESTRGLVYAAAKIDFKFNQ